MWTQPTLEALNTWLGPATGLVHHPLDDERFHLFMLAVWDECHSLWDEQAARETITNRAKELHPDFGEDGINESVDERMSQGTLILDFLCNVKEAGRNL